MELIETILKEEGYLTEEQPTTNEEVNESDNNSQES